MDIKRKLATIQTIKTVEPIPNADSIVKITFESNGWVCVTNKDTNPIPGDRRIYFEIDSILPEIPIFEFMRPYKFKVKTISLRKQISQGLSIPLKEIEPYLPTLQGVDLYTLPDKFDLTDILGVVKYELPPDVQLSGDTKGSFPGFIVKTDEERATNIDNLTDLLASHEWDVTIKMDGSSETIYLRDGEFGVCSRNQELKETEGNTFWKLARKYKIEERLRALNVITSINYALQGEAAGPGIQGNRIGLKDLELFVFTIQNIDKYSRLSNTEIEETLNQLNSFFPEAPSLRMVPKIKDVPSLKTLDDVALLSEGSYLVTDRIREGIVLRAKDDPSISFKFINPKYLLKHDL